jgi:hypothetical protein
MVTAATNLGVTRAPDSGGPRSLCRQDRVELGGSVIPAAPLPLLDEHATPIAADLYDVWDALLDVVDRVFSRGPASTYALVVGCNPAVSSGPRPLTNGSTIPGFRVAQAVPHRELELVGRHRYSSYALTFRLEDLGAGCTALRAETRAEFPGVAGGIYRLLVVGSGGHVVAVRRLLGRVRRRAVARGRCARTSLSDEVPT